MIKKLSSVLRVPEAYRLLGATVGRRAATRSLLSEYVSPKAGEKILDIGCGPAGILELLPEVDYLGLDISPEYIESAKKRFSDRGRFLCIDVDMASLGQENGTFDLVLAKGVIHHLDEDSAHRLFRLASVALKPGGQLVTYDGCYVDGQSTIARWFLDHDRGEFVRTEKEYLRLATPFFTHVASDIRHDLLRIPYTHVILRCSNQAARDREAQ